MVTIRGWNTTTAMLRSPEIFKLKLQYIRLSYIVDARVSEVLPSAIFSSDSDVRG